MGNNKIIIGIAAVLGLVVIVLVLNSGNSTQSESVPGTHQANISQSADNKEKAPDFSLQKLSGGTITLSEYQGKKAVILDFFATWCPNCRRDMPVANKLYEKYKNDIEVIGINLQENPKKVEDFIASRGIIFPIALDPRNRASSAYGVRYTNFHVLIDKQGDILRLVPGDIREKDFLDLIK